MKFIWTTVILTWLVWIYKAVRRIWSFFSGHDLRQALEDYKVEQAIAEVEGTAPKSRK